MGRWSKKTKEAEQEAVKLIEDVNKLAAEVAVGQGTSYNYELTKSAITSSNYTTNIAYQRRRTVGEVSELPSVHDRVINLLEEFNESGEVDEKKMYELVNHILIEYSG